MVRTMEWAASSTHLSGVPRSLIIKSVGTFAKLITTYFNKTTVHNSDTLLRLVTSRPPNTPLITVSNHMSTLDDPLLWGWKGFPITDVKLARWVLAAEDICFKNVVFSYFFRLGKCIPITRGGGLYQEHMNEALERLSAGAWLHTFPEGKVYQENQPIRRLKWGTASLIERAPVTPIVLPIVHRGFEKVMPENYSFGRRPLIPLCNKKISIMIGDPIEFDIPQLRQTAINMSPEHSCSDGKTSTSHHQVLDSARRWLYSAISEKIRTVMEQLRSLNASKSDL